MAWEHRLAQQLNAGQKKTGMTWFTGNVLSPIPVVYTNPDGSTYTVLEGELIVACFNGQVILKADRLREFENGDELQAGQEVALLGDLFSGHAGSQKILILGVLA